MTGRWAWSLICTPVSTGGAWSCSPARRARQAALDAGELPDFLPETAAIRERRLARRAGAAPISGPPRRDHRPGRPQDGDQRAQLRRAASSWPTSRTPTRRPGRTSSTARSTCAMPSTAPSPSASPDGQALPPQRRRPRRCIVRPRGWHLEEKHVLRRRQTDLGLALRLRPVLLSQRAHAARAAAAARTSICRRWRAISRRGCGTTSSSPRRNDSACRAGTIAPRC